MKTRFHQRLAGSALGIYSPSNTNFIYEFSDALTSELGELFSCSLNKTMFCVPRRKTAVSI